MGDPDTAAKADVEIPGYGKLAVAPDASAPLLVVFGGIDVNGVQSGIYMWNYMKGIRDRFHIFVSRSNAVNGTLSYRSLTSTLKAKNLTASKQVLYLFSGGYGPGMTLLTSDGPDVFSWIYLVDIWMGVTEKSGSRIPEFYKGLVDGNAAKMTYVYTKFGANNEKARDYIAKKLGLGATLVEGRGMDAHMSTNSVAVKNL